MAIMLVVYLVQIPPKRKKEKGKRDTFYHRLLHPQDLLCTTTNTDDIQ